MMKRFFLGLMLLVCIASACNKQTANVISNSTFMSYTNGVLKVRSTGYGNNMNEATTAAEKAALEALMFRGIPGSQQDIPLVNIDEKSKEENRKYFNEFFNGLRYKTFITSSTAVSQLEKVEGGKIEDDVEKKSLGKYRITSDIGINLTSLRKDLEQNEIIRKFGY